MFVPAALDDAGLSPEAFRIFGRVCRRWSPERGCDESKARMMAELGIGRDPFWAALRELEARRFVERSGRGKGARIDWLPPSEWLDARPAEAENGPDSGPNRKVRQEDQTDDEWSGERTKEWSDSRTKRMVRNPDHKGIPPEGDPLKGPSEPAAAGRDEEGGADPVPDAAAVEDEKRGDPSDPRNRAYVLLAERGVDGPVAKRLAAAHAAESVDAVATACHRFDREGGKSPGWLVRAVEEGYASAPPSPSRQAATPGRPREAEEGSKIPARLVAEDAAGRPGQSAEPPDWRELAEAERLAELARLDGHADYRQPTRRSPLRDLPTAPVDGAQPQDS